MARPARLDRVSRRGPRRAGSGRRGGQPVAGEHPQRDEQAVGQFIERFAALLNDSGIPRMPARIFAALLATDDSRLTADEIAGLLRVSPAAVSGGVRYLIQVGLVSREAEPG